MGNGCAGARRQALKKAGVYRSDIMEFLVVFQDDDYVKDCAGLAKSYSDKIIKERGKLPGILHTINMLEINEILSEDGRTPKYIIKGTTLPHIMYIRLPREQLYVQSDKWEYEYMKSQIQELIVIFGLLGAKKISYNVSGSAKSNVNIGAEVTAGNLPIDVGASVCKGKNNSSHLSGDIVFPEPETELEAPDVDVFIQHDGIYYLPRMFHWTTMVENRLERGVLSDSFDYQFQSDVALSASVTAKFQSLGISCNIGGDKMESSRVMFNIEYYPMKLKKHRYHQLGRPRSHRIYAPDEHTISLGSFRNGQRGRDIMRSGSLSPPSLRRVIRRTSSR